MKQYDTTRLNTKMHNLQQLRHSRTLYSWDRSAMGGIFVS